MVSPDAQGEALYTFERHTIELIHPGVDARITLRVEGDSGLKCFWTNPVLYPQGRIGRERYL